MCSHSFCILSTVPSRSDDRASTLYSLHQHNNSTQQPGQQHSSSSQQLGVLCLLCGVKHRTAVKCYSFGFAEIQEITPQGRLPFNALEGRGFQRHLLFLGHLQVNNAGDGGKEIKDIASATTLFVVAQYVRKLILYYAYSMHARSALFEHCERLNIARKDIIFPVPTRWRSDLLMIGRAHYLRQALVAVTAAEMNLSAAKAQEYRKVVANFQAVLHFLPHIIAISRLCEQWHATEVPNCIIILTKILTLGTITLYTRISRALASTCGLNKSL